MYYFSRHELITDGDGYSVRLYLDESRHEFASDFFGRARAEQKTGAGSLDTAARRYVKNKFPGVGVRTAYILFGALLIATIPLTDSAAQQAPDPAPDCEYCAYVERARRRGDALTQ